MKNRKQPCSPFITASAMGNVNDVKIFWDNYYMNWQLTRQSDLLLYEGIDFTGIRYTGLMAAARFDRVDVVEFFLEKGADCSQLCSSNIIATTHSCGLLMEKVPENVNFLSLNQLSQLSNCF